MFYRWNAIVYCTKKKGLILAFFCIVLVKALKCIIFLSAQKDEVMSLKIYALNMNSAVLFSHPL